MKRKKETEERYGYTGRHRPIVSHDPTVEIVGEHKVERAPGLVEGEKTRVKWLTEEPPLWPTWMN